MKSEASIPHKSIMHIAYPYFHTIFINPHSPFSAKFINFPLFSNNLLFTEFKLFCFPYFDHDASYFTRTGRLCMNATTRDVSKL